MAWRFKVSKYKNAAPKIPKKDEWITNLPVGNLMQSPGNYIKASCAYMVFNINSSGGGSLGVLPLSASGRQGNNIPVIHAHGDFVTDFDFSPFDDYLFVSGSLDGTVKIWLLPDDPEFESITNPEVSLPSPGRRVENVLWNPAVEGVLAVSSNHVVKIFDVAKSQEKCALDSHDEVVQSMSWRSDGSLLATSCKDKLLRIFDPRSGSLAQEGKGHQNIRETRVLWMGSKDLVLSTGFEENRARSIGLWDARNLNRKLASVLLDTSTGVLMPFYDPDTNMLFFAGKGDNSLRYIELTEKDPYITEGITDSTEQVRGAAMIPKRAVDVMQGEVNRLLLLVQKCIIPAPYIVPRKSYRDYHEDLFPDTFDGNPPMTADGWFAGENKPFSLMSLNPSKRHGAVTRRGSLFGSSSWLSPAPPTQASSLEIEIASPNIPKEETEIPKPFIAIKKPAEIASPKPGGPSPITVIDKHKNGRSHKLDFMEEDSVIHKREGTQNGKGSRSSVEKLVSNFSESTKDSVTSHKEVRHVPVRPRHTKAFTAVRQSKYRHLKGQVLHKSLHFDNLRGVCNTVPGEGNMFHANKKRFAVPLQGAGGNILIIEADTPGKQPDTGNPVIQNGSKITDFAWDPFDDCHLVTAGDNSQINVWNIEETGLEESRDEPDMCLNGHTEKIYFISFHPLAKDVLASGSYDMTVRIWDIAQGTEKILLEGHTDTIFCFAWSPDGKRCATLCKDHKIRIYEPRISTEPIMEGTGPEGSRGARVVWVLDGKYLFVTGFTKMSGREISIYDVNNPKSPLSKIDLDNSPSILIPFYDEDSSTVFLLGRGDDIMTTFEVYKEEPYLFQLASYKPGGQSKAFSFLAKDQCDVRNIEFAKAYRLTKSTVEPVSFTVPRVKAEFFQDDLFPDTKVTWEPTMTSSEWFAGVNRVQRRISLRPPDMPTLHQAPAEVSKPKKFESYNPDTYKTDEQKKEELLRAMGTKLDHSDDPLPQDLTEGVDADEWDD